MFWLDLYAAFYHKKGWIYKCLIQTTETERKEKGFMYHPVITSSVYLIYSIRRTDT